MATSTAVDAWESLFRAQVAIMRRLNAEFPDDAVSFTEYDVLLNLAVAPKHELPMRRLIDNVLLSQPSVSRLVDRLTHRGLLVKTPDPNDARATIVSMTPHGLTVFRRVARAHGASIDSAVGSRLDVAELDDLKRLCDKLRGV